MGCRFHRFNPCVWSRLFGLRLTSESSDMTCHGVVASHPFAESLSKGTQFKPVPEAIHFRLAAKTPLGSPRGDSGFALADGTMNFVSWLCHAVA